MISWDRYSQSHCFACGIDTDRSVLQTVAAVASCILGLLDKPEVLRKAQRELDSVVKRGHLPDFEDQVNLPYITAITMETLRWRDVAPIGESSVRQGDIIYPLILFC